VLGGQQFVQGKPGGPLAQRELLVAVAEHRGAVLAGAGLEAARLVTDPPREYGQQHLAAAGRPVDVEPACVPGLRPVAQHLPQLAVVAGCGGHVVRHDVQDQPEPVLARRGGQLPQPLLTPQLGPDPAVVDHVVAVS
jgi:hypothetical protein